MSCLWSVLQGVCACSRLVSRITMQAWCDVQGAGFFGGANCSPAGLHGVVGLWMVCRLHMDGLELLGSFVWSGMCGRVLIGLLISWHVHTARHQHTQCLAWVHGGKGGHCLGSTAVGAVGQLSLLLQLQRCEAFMGTLRGPLPHCRELRAGTCPSYSTEDFTAMCMGLCRAGVCVTPGCGWRMCNLRRCSGRPRLACTATDNQCSSTGL